LWYGGFAWGLCSVGLLGSHAAKGRLAVTDFLAQVASWGSGRQVYEWKSFWFFFFRKRTACRLEQNPR
jgi:hypothetical protein